MKKTLLLLLCVVCSQVSFAQISRISEPQKNQPTISKFDSTKNIIIPTTEGVYDPNIQTFVGQKIYLKPLRKFERESGYTSIVTMDYDPERPPYLYHYKQYSLLSEKTYEIIKIDTFLTKYKGYIFTLRMVEDENILCKYIYHGHEYGCPFITISHYNYLCNTYKGGKYILSNYCFNDKTYEEMKKEPRIKPWTVEDISVDDEGVLYVIVKNDEIKDKITLEDFRNNLEDPKYSKNVFSELEWNSLVKQYGLDMMKSVLMHHIKIGMPEKLVKYSWGKPERINTSSYGDDQWCYDGQYVYFKNHKVSAWN